MPKEKSQPKNYKNETELLESIKEDINLIYQSRDLTRIMGVAEKLAIENNHLGHIIIGQEEIRVLMKILFDAEKMKVSILKQIIEIQQVTNTIVDISEIVLYFFTYNHI